MTGIDARYKCFFFFFNEEKKKGSIKVDTTVSWGKKSRDVDVESNFAHTRVVPVFYAIFAMAPDAVGGNTSYRQVSRNAFRVSTDPDTFYEHANVRGFLVPLHPAACLHNGPLAVSVA